jgi:hypothetical protein
MTLQRRAERLRDACAREAISFQQIGQRVDPRYLCPRRQVFQPLFAFLIV